MANPTKYPRTLHLPWSPGRSRDDLVINGIEHFEHMERLVVTEKLDGENSTLYNDNFHARSLDSRTHPSRNWLKAFHASLCYRIPENIRICGENVFAKHSIGYTELTTYFYAFAVYRDTLCLDWAETKALCVEWGIELVPVLYEGPWDEKLIKDCWKNSSAFGTSQEGYVVRNAGSFSSSKFGENVAKYVRPGHVNSETHWMNAPVEPNRLDGA
jgi:hypothetical protein